MPIMDAVLVESKKHYYTTYYHPFLIGDEDSYDETQENGKEFYTIVRTHVIYSITILLLYALSYYLISRFSRNKDEFRLDIEEYKPYRISTWICAFTLAISMAAFLLLPVSIITNEVSWTDDDKTKRSLLDGMWKYVFLFSNLSLFFLLPFAYFLPEAEGFSGSRRGMSSRLRETFVLLMIVTIIALGLTYTVCCLFFGIGCLPATNNYYHQLLTVWRYLPFLYSCISFIGTLLLLLCTPLGISHLFSVLHYMETIQKTRRLYTALFIALLGLAGYSIILVIFNSFQLLVGFRPLPLSGKIIMSEEETSLDIYTKDEHREQEELYKSDGPIMAFLDIVMILYLWCASLCGLYNLPGLCCLRPRKNDTSFNQIIGNCTILCLLSSALPLLSKTLGMTNFDLVADFGRVEWLGNLYIVLLYNFVFFVSTIVCLIGKRNMVFSIKDWYHKKRPTDKEKET